MRKLLELGVVSEDTRANAYLGSTKDGSKAIDPSINRWVFLKVTQDSMQRDFAPVG